MKITTEKPSYPTVNLLKDVCDGVHPLFILYYERKVTMKRDDRQK